jgi:hypothetical protein
MPIRKIRYAIYGCGEGGKRTLHCIDLKRTEVVCFVDSDEGKWGTEIKGYPVVGSFDLQKLGIDKILIASQHEGEIRNKLLLEGWTDSRILFVGNAVLRGDFEIRWKDYFRKRHNRITDSGRSFGKI